MNYCKDCRLKTTKTSEDNPNWFYPNWCSHYARECSTQRYDLGIEKECSNFQPKFLYTILRYLGII